MSTRGMKFHFEPGEYVLCFEPDATKARVLYDAKVLETASSRDKRGHLKAEYLVHFQGWNSSWDRLVPESFVQKNHSENRALMKRLAEVARNVKKNRSRKRRIDCLLKAHFKCKMPPSDTDDSSDSNENSDDEDDDDDEEDEDETTEEEDEDDIDPETEESDHGKSWGSRRSASYHERDMYSRSRMNDSTEDESEEVEEKEATDGLERIYNHQVSLHIPTELQHKLEDDCYMINRRKKLLSLPAEPNVLTVLEGYVKNFALNILYGTVEKPRLREHQNTPPEKNIDLCKEVMEGLRIYFDFTLPSLLLYNSEQAQHSKLISSCKPTPTIKKELDESVSSPPVTSPRLRSGGRQPMSPVASEPSPKIPRLSPKTVKKDREDLSGDEIPPRRMTRNAYQAEIRRSRKYSKPYHKTSHRHGSSVKKKSHSHVQRSERTEGREVRRRGSLRSSSRHTTDNASEAAGVSASLSDRVTPPPPLLIPSVISSKASKGSASPRHTPTYKSLCSTPTMTDNDKEGMMSCVLAWRLIPEDSYDELPMEPCFVYGAPHLLRMFVRLPDLLNKMAIPKEGIAPLVKHLHMFLEYLADNSEKLFPESNYIDNPDVSTPKHSTSKR